MEIIVHFSVVTFWPINHYKQSYYYYYTVTTTYKGCVSSSVGRTLCSENLDFSEFLGLCPFQIFFN